MVPLMDMRPGGASSSPPTSLTSSSSSPRSRPSRYSVAVNPPSSMTNPASKAATSHSQRRMDAVTFRARAPPAQMKQSAEFAFMNSPEATQVSNGGTLNHQPASANAPIATQANPAAKAGRLEGETSCIAGSVTPVGQRAKEVLPGSQMPRLTRMKRTKRTTA